MTVIIAAIGNKHIVVGSDKKGTKELGGFSFVENSEVKLKKLSDYVVGMVAGNGYVGAEFFERFKIKRDVGITEVANKFSSFCNAEAVKIFKIATKTNIPIKYLDTLPSFILAGLDPKKGKYTEPKIFRLDPMHSFYPTREKRYAAEGKSFLAEYLLAKYYTSKATQNELPKLVAQAIFDTGMIDPNVSTAMNMEIIDKDGIRELSQNIIEDLVETWEEVNLKSIIRES
jgi:20S proteasome alpha/beta subunit